MGPGEDGVDSIVVRGKATVAALGCATMMIPEGIVSSLRFRGL